MTELSASQPPQTAPQPVAPATGGGASSISLPPPAQAVADATTESDDAFGLSPTRLAWRRLRANRAAMLGAGFLLLFYIAATLGSFIAPYSGPEGPESDLTFANMSPTRLHFIDAAGHFHARPFIYGMQRDEAQLEKQVWKEDRSTSYPVHFLIHGPAQYKLWWTIVTDRHLFGVDDPTARVALLGCDSQGRDWLTCLLEGSKISLTVGLIGITISLLIGMTVGGLAGYYGGWTDTLSMRLVEFLLSIPTLYLILSVRAFFQVNKVFGIGGKDLSSTQMYILIIVLLSLVGWAGIARVVRGMVLSIREQDYITAERALGASTLRIVWKHILPNTLSYVIVSATISIPSYILGEVVLSYLNVGIQDPQVSWGNMLESAQSLDLIKQQPWLLFAPATAIFLTVMAYNFLGDGLRDAIDPKHVK